MEMYRFFQRKTESVWLGLKEVGQATQKKAQDDGAIKLSILSISSLLPEEEKGDVFYKGPWYADIDCAQDIPEAALSTLKLLDKLVSLDVPRELVQVFASGSKGFHLLIDAKHFSQNRPQKNLPQIYKLIAARLFVYGMDMQVYSGKKGVCWRLANVQRDDTGTYRVPITADELQGMTKERYKELVSGPREVATPASAQIAPKFRELFMQCSAEVTNIKPMEFVDTPEDLRVIQETQPSCVELIAQGKVKPEMNFNQVALQVATYIVRVQPDQLAVDALVEKIAQVYESSTHSQKHRRESLTGSINYVNHSPGYKFSCAGMRSVLLSNRCKQCPVYKVDVEHDLAKKMGIEEQEDGYYCGTGESRRRICSFRLDVKAVLKEYNHDGTRAYRTGSIVNVLVNNENLTEVVLEENTWKNKSNFIATFSGLSNLGFFGNDVDVQKIKHLVLAKEEEMSEIVRVYSAGMQVKRVSGTPVLTYVEPDYSVNSAGIRDLYMVTGSVPSPVNIGKVKLINGNQKRLQALEAGLKLLLQVNSPLVVAQMLGWVCGCHLKMHIRHSDSSASSFPLLSIHGSAESGKNRTAELFTWLNGCRFGAEQAVFSAPTARAFPLVNLLTTSTTIPRIIDELNIERIGKRNFDWIAEQLKCSWDCSSVPRGTINGNKQAGNGATSAGLVEQQITAPVIYCSEQAITENTALLQRSISVHVSAKTRAGRDQVYSDVLKFRENFHDFARHLVQSALNTPIDNITYLLEENDKLIPASLTDRTRHCFTVLLVGLEFFRATYQELGLSLDNEFQAVYGTLISFMETNQAEITRESQWSNIDSVVETIALMASFKGEPGREIIRPNSHFVYDPEAEAVYLRAPVVFALYKQYTHRQGDDALIRSYSAFMRLVKEQPYFLTDEHTRLDVFEGDKCLALSLEHMKKRGIHASFFI